jgi:hypothetical protein
MLSPSYSKNKIPEIYLTGGLTIKTIVSRKDNTRTKTNKAKRKDNTRDKTNKVKRKDNTRAKTNKVKRKDNTRAKKNKALCLS